MARPDDVFDSQTRLELEAAAFRRLTAHLDERKDVQNIDLMNLAGFCRNCISKWYLAAAEELGKDLDYDKAREIVYGMPYTEWKEKYQTEASTEQKKVFDASFKHS
ncbi:MAG: deoxycytidine triphosphate deaminase [Rhodospirillaceae bacterium]|nr:deoxycytidine triphosphate deaminase [Rhodospirillaceae bacterium]|tara:strand:+ start:312 stop:629 length:318 start_codon:yes stop_codon:yes gene_type:complete